MPGVCFRVVRDQELRAARELAEGTCHVPYSTTHVCVAFTACADAAAVSTPNRVRPTCKSERDLYESERDLYESERDLYESERDLYES